MKKLYQKSELTFSLVWIGVYCVVMSLADNLSAEVGIDSVISAPVIFVLSVVLALFLRSNSLFDKYGICRPQVRSSKMLFYIPLVLLLTVNLWYGVRMNLSPLETCLYILKMLGVGFLEELIFRGFLFNAMVKDSAKSAIIVSSVTFGFGHIINLFNGSGAELLPNLVQIISAVAIGFAFVMIYYKTRSLLVSIITHGVFNSLSAFSNEGVLTDGRRILSCVFIVLISLGYGLYITVGIKEEK